MSCPTCSNCTDLQNLKNQINNDITELQAMQGYLNSVINNNNGELNLVANNIYFNGASNIYINSYQISNTPVLRFGTPSHVEDFHIDGTCNTQYQ